MQSIAMLDIILLILMLILAVHGMLQGFVREILSITSWICGILGAIFFYKPGAEFIGNRFFQGVGILPEVLSFFLVFFIIFLFIKVLAVLLRDILHRLELGGLDRFIGVLLGFIEGLVCVVAALFVITLQPVFETEPIFEGSVFAQLFLPLIEPHIPVHFTVFSE